MSTLDDAREGMDLSVRPQDDLFGHVNGRWLLTAEIPADKGSWGPFVQLADVAEEQVRSIIEELAERVVAGEQGLDGDAMRIACLYASFMDEGTVDRLGCFRLRRDRGHDSQFTHEAEPRAYLARRPARIDSAG